MKALIKKSAAFPGRFRAARPAAFSRVELLVALAALAVVAALIIVPIRLTRDRARLRLCTDNLQQVSQAVLQYANEHQGQLPGPSASVPDTFWWFYKELVKGYVGLSGPSSTNDRVFACPLDRGYSDPKPFCRSSRFDYGSYVFNGVTLPGVPSIAGWKLAAVSQPKRTLLVMEWSAHAPLSWHRSRTGKANAPFYSGAQSVVAFADGRASFIPIYYDGYSAAFTRDPIAGYEYKYSGR